MISNLKSWKLFAAANEEGNCILLAKDEVEPVRGIVWAIDVWCCSWGCCWWCHSTEELDCKGLNLRFDVRNISWSNDDDFNLARANLGAGGKAGVVRIERGVDGGEGIRACWVRGNFFIKKLLLLLLFALMAGG